MSYKDQVVLITGGASGIGKASVIEFAKEGAKVVFADIQKEKGTKLKDDLIKKKYPLKKASLKLPFTRICKPSAYGLKSCGLKEGMRTGRVNPNGYQTDSTSNLFYKFYWDGKNKLIAGKTGH